MARFSCAFIAHENWIRKLVYGLLYLPSEGNIKLRKDRRYFYPANKNGNLFSVWLILLVFGKPYSV